jgi:hypothetical protein
VGEEVAGVVAEEAKKAEEAGSGPTETVLNEKIRIQPKQSVDTINTTEDGLGIEKANKLSATSSPPLFLQVCIRNRKNMSWDSTKTETPISRNNRSPQFIHLTKLACKKSGPHRI